MNVPYCIGPRPLPSDAPPPTARLRIALPPALILRAEAGRYVPNLHQVRLDVGADGVVTIGGYGLFVDNAMAGVLDQAARFLVTLAEPRMAPQSFAGEIEFANAARPEKFLIALGARVVIAQGARGLLIR